MTGTGVDAMKAFDQVWTNAASDFTVTPLVQLSVDGKVSSENLVEATHDGILRLPTGDLPATGRTFGGRYVGIVRGRRRADRLPARLLRPDDRGRPADVRARLTLARPIDA